MGASGVSLKRVTISTHTDHKNRFLYPKVCAGAAVRQQCPQACQSQMECLTVETAPDTYFVWDRIKKIDGANENGTICLSDETPKSKVNISNAKNFMCVPSSLKISLKEITNCLCRWSMHAEPGSKIFLQSRICHRASPSASEKSQVSSSGSRYGLCRSSCRFQKLISYLQMTFVYLQTSDVHGPQLCQPWEENQYD